MRSWRDWSWDDGNFWGSGLQPLYEDVNKPFATATVSIPDGLDKEQTKKALNNEIRSLSDSTPGFDMDKTRVKVESVNPVEVAKTKEKSISDDRELSL
jgi:hypothetical protein